MRLTLAFVRMRSFAYKLPPGLTLKIREVPAPLIVWPAPSMLRTDVRTSSPLVRVIGAANVMAPPAATAVRKSASVATGPATQQLPEYAGCPKRGRGPGGERPTDQLRPAGRVQGSRRSCEQTSRLQIHHSTPHHCPCSWCPAVSIIKKEENILPGAVSMQVKQMHNPRRWAGSLRVSLPEAAAAVYTRRLRYTTTRRGPIAPTPTTSHLVSPL